MMSTVISHPSSSACLIMRQSIAAVTRRQQASRTLLFKGTATISTTQTRLVSVDTNRDDNSTFNRSSSCGFSNGSCDSIRQPNNSEISSGALHLNQQKVLSPGRPGLKLPKSTSLLQLPVMDVNVDGTRNLPKLYYSTSRTVHQELWSDSLHNRINDLAREPQTSVSLNALMKTGRGEYLHKTFGENVNKEVANNEQAATELVLIQVAGFLRRELPIRMAHRIQDLEGIPVLRDMEHVKLVRDLYAKSIRDILEFDSRIATAEQEHEFSQIIERIYERHSSVLVQMARGAYEFRNAVRMSSSSKNGFDGSEFELQEETHAFLDRFYLCRIGIRVLIGQYLALRQPPVENYVGIICSHTSPYEIVKRAIDDAAFMCTRIYGDSPEVIMSGRLDLSFPYVPTHLHYIMLELIKNSMRATVEWHGVDGDFPPIKVIIADGQENEDVVIKVSDEGGGIPRSNMKKIWSYLFTTADPSIQEGMVGNASKNVVDHGIDSPLAGLGYGLPISRSYCRYFGGDLSIMSMEGYGTDAFVYLTRLGNTQEPLPI